MAGIAKKSRKKSRYSEEVTYGTTAAVALTEIRHTGTNFSHNISGEVSDEINGTRNKKDYTALAASNTGDVPFELSSGAQDDFIEGAMFSDWSTALTVTAIDVSAANADNSFNTVAGDYVALGIVVGMRVEVRGFTTAINNGYFTVVSVAVGKIVVSGATLTTEVAGDTVIIKNDGSIKNGLVTHSYTIEDEYPEIPRFFQYKGMVVNSMNMTTTKGAKLTGSFSFMGADAAHAGATTGTGAHLAAPTNAVMNSTNNVSNILEAGAALATGVYITDLTFSLSNGLENVDIIGSKTPVALSEGDCEVSGSATFLFANADLYDKFINDTASSLSYKVEDAAGNAIIITFPNVNYTAAPISGDKSLAMAMSFNAIYDTTTACSIQMDKFSA